LQVQTSSSSIPIQIVYGANKIAPNCFWSGNFQYKAQKAGGKGGGQVTGYTYTCDLMLGLCEGPINAVGGVWNNNSITYMWNLGLSLFEGSSAQAKWGYLDSAFHDQALFYRGLAYVAAEAFYLGSSPNLPALSFDVHGLLVGTGLLSGNEWDASPALVVQDFLTNAQYGVGFPAASINSATLLSSSGNASYQTYCQAIGLAISPVLSNQETANSVLTRWLQLTNAAAVWSGGELKVIPYGDSACSGNGASYAPNLAPIYNLTDDDFVHQDGKDPVEVVRSDPFTAKNWVSVEFLDRNNWYDSSIIQAWDQNAIELYGLNVMPTVTAHEFCFWWIAQISAQLILQRSVYIRNAYHFKLSFEHCLLEPMDLVTITDSGLGMNNVTVRITSIEEGDGGVLAVEAEEFPTGIASAVAYPVQGGFGSQNVIGLNVVPAPVNAPLIFEPPPALTAGDAEVWVALSGGVPVVHKLAEDSSTGHHSAQWSGPSGAVGALTEFSVSVQAAERAAVSIQAYDGLVTSECEFDLSAMTATPASGAVFSNVGITAESGGFVQVSVSLPLQAAGQPTFTLLIAQPVGTISYAGTLGVGVYVWGPQVSTAEESLSALSSTPVLAGSTFAAEPSVATPEGAAGGADPHWGGASVYLSTDGSTYAQVGQIKGPARQGFLTASIAAPSVQPDTTNAMAVSLVESGGELASGTSADAQRGVTLCVVDNELFAYATATLTAPNAYNLTYLARGLYGSAATSHATNAPFARLDDLIFKYSLPSALVGATIYMKFASFNIFGQAVQDLSTCVAYSYTPVGSGTVGPIAQALAVGSNLDLGSVSTIPNEADSFGLATDPYITPLDLGTAP
jgi:hypothetical protein